MVVVDHRQDDYVLAMGHLGGDMSRALVHVKEAFADAVRHRPCRPDLAGLIKLETSGRSPPPRPRRCSPSWWPTAAATPRRSPRRKGFEAMDDGALAALVDQAIADNAAVWAKFVGGEGKAMGALVGAVMKASKGQADGKAVTALLNARKG